MKVRIYGPGCMKCNTLVDLVTKAAGHSGLNCDIEKVTDLNEIISAGVITTPGLEIDGVIVLQGKIPSLAQLVVLLNEHVT